VLGRFELSEAEFGAILGRLAQSAGCYCTGPASRNYLDQVLRIFE
jgi:hypothetical protein